jgi:hypothetical protein
MKAEHGFLVDLRFWVFILSMMWLSILAPATSED